MREIKFRAKNKASGKWYYGSDRVVIDKGTLLVPIAAFWSLVSQGFLDRNTIGQYTELRDRNDKEIYEGDIINRGTWRRYVVRYGSFWWKEDGYVGFYLERQDENKHGFPMLDEMLYPEVIGNEFENPELMEEK